MVRILVTGTSSGIGEHTAKYLSAQNIDVVGVSRRDPSAELSSSEHYTHIKGDLTEEATIKQIAAAVSPSLDGAVFNAGILDSVTKVTNTNLADFRRVFDVNSFSVVDSTRAVAPYSKKAEGRAIYVSSGASTNPYGGWAAYGASKAALNLVAATLAKEEPELTVLSVAPGVVDTGMQDLIRGTYVGTGEMGADAQKFMELKQNNQSSSAEQQGALYGKLVLRAPHESSGKYLRYNDEAIVNIK